MARTNLHEAAELLTPSNELSNIMRRDQLLIDMPWKQGLLSVMELCFDPRARAGLGLQNDSAASEHAGAVVRNQLMPLLEFAGPPRLDALTALTVLTFEPQTVKLLAEVGAAPLLLRELHRAPEGAGPEEARQLAAWLAFAASDVFVFKPLCEFDHGGVDGGTRYYGARLSSWSSIAMLMGGTDTFHFLCEEPGSHGARCENGTKMAEVVEAGSHVAACDVEAANRLSLGAGHTMRHVAAESAAPAGVWSLGSFVR